MTTSVYCLYVGVDYTYIDINALAQGLKSFLASQVCHGLTAVGCSLSGMNLYSFSQS